MKNLLLGVFLALRIVTTAHPIINDTIVSALKEGNSETIAIYFDSSIDLTIPSNEGVFSKTQAELILKTFFVKNEPSNFEIVHNGESKNDTFYSIGSLATHKGTYRTYILYKKIGKKITISELRIESD